MCDHKLLSCRKDRDIRTSGSGLLSEFEKREIETKVHCELFETVDRDQTDVDFFVENISESIDSTVANLSYSSNFPDFEERIPLNFDPNLNLVRIDTYCHNGALRLLSEEDKLVLARIHEVFNSPSIVDIPSLKEKDTFQVSKETSLVNCLLHNVVVEDICVTTVNKLLYAGSFVVRERLGLFTKRMSKKS